MAVLFIGRFQPIHSGHLSVLSWLRSQGEAEIIIGVGSSQYAATIDNPLSFATRQACWQRLEPTLPVIAIPDIHDDEHWVEHVQKVVYTAYPSGFRQMVSGNPWVQRLAATAGIPVLSPPQTLAIDATTIRQLIRNQTDTWKPYVPTAIHELITEPIISSGAKTSR